VGAFGFGDSLYTNPKPDEPSGNLGSHWFEGAVKPAITGTYTSSRSWQLWGKLSAVGEGTFGQPPDVVGGNASSFRIEDLALGFRSGAALGGLKEDALELTVGRSPYHLGHGFLLYDGAAEGGSRGGYWSNARKAFEFAAVLAFKPEHHTLEAFYLVPDEVPEAQTGSRLWGINYEFSPDEHSTFGATYMKWHAHRDEAPQRDGLNVYNLRAYTAPIPPLRALSFEGEYAKEDNGAALDSQAWTVLGAYHFGGSWAPKLSYRYAYFEGQAPRTGRNEAFDPLLTGFSDWGSWWQGEIMGEYVVPNSNLVSHQVRLHTEPRPHLGTGLIFYKFLLDRPSALGAGVTSNGVASEVDWYTDWKINKAFTLSVVAALASPGKAVEQAYDRTKDFVYGMVFLAYSY
jgi:hypothetical protein